MVVYDDPSDVELWNKIKCSDERAFNLLFARYAPILINHGYNKYRDRELSKDFTQDIFIKLWDNRETQEFNSTLKQFLYVSFRNSFFNNFKRQDVKDRYMESLLHFSNGESCHADHLICEKELALQIEKEIEELPERMRQVFILKYKYDYSYKVIAEMQGITISTAKKHYYNATGTLKKKFGEFICLLWMI